MSPYTRVYYSKSEIYLMLCNFSWLDRDIKSCVRMSNISLVSNNISTLEVLNRGTVPQVKDKCDGVSSLPTRVKYNMVYCLPTLTLGRLGKHLPGRHTWVRVTGVLYECMSAILLQSGREKCHSSCYVCTYTDIIRIITYLACILVLVYIGVCNLRGNAFCFLYKNVG